jgi:hypothetical protein
MPLIMTIGLIICLFEDKFFPKKKYQNWTNPNGIVGKYNSGKEPLWLKIRDFMNNIINFISHCD